MTASFLRKFALLGGLVLLSFSLGVQPALADDDDDGGDDRKKLEVNCDSDESVQKAVDEVKSGEPTTIFIKGVCNEDVTITKDDVTLKGKPGATVGGTITITGARRVIIESLKVTGSGSGVIGQENAAFTVSDSDVSGNDVDGISVQDGAHANIIDNTIAENGQSEPPNDGRGVVVEDGATADILRNTVEDNYSDGIGVFNGAYARVQENIIESNGRVAVDDAGVQVARAHVRAGGNRYKNNPYAAIVAYNEGHYRAGNFLDVDGLKDNVLPFEQIDKGTDGLYAIDMGRHSLVDLRQVNVTGTAFVGGHSTLQIRGDSVPPDEFCSTFSGTIDAFGIFAVVLVRKTNVTGGVLLGTDARLNGSPSCP